MKPISLGEHKFFINRQNIRAYGNNVAIFNSNRLHANTGGRSELPTALCPHPGIKIQYLPWLRIPAIPAPCPYRLALNSGFNIRRKLFFKIQSWHFYTPNNRRAPSLFVHITKRPHLKQWLLIPCVGYGSSPRPSNALSTILHDGFGYRQAF